MEDQQIVEDLRERLELWGLDPSQAEEMVRKAQKPTLRKGSPSAPFLVQPQREWEECRRRLNEHAQRLATVVLNNVGLSMNGTELPYRYKSLGITGRNNYVSAVMMVHAEVDRRLGKKRAEATTEEFKDVLENLNDVLQTVVRRVHKAKSDYEKSQT